MPVVSRRLFRGGRIVDLAAGHCLLAESMLILDDTSPQAVALLIKVVPPSAATLHRALVDRWPRLTGRIEFLGSPLEFVVIRPTESSCPSTRAVRSRIGLRARDRGAGAGRRPALLSRRRSV